MEWVLDVTIAGRVEVVIAIADEDGVTIRSLVTDSTREVVVDTDKLTAVVEASISLSIALVVVAALLVVDVKITSLVLSITLVLATVVSLGVESIVLALILLVTLELGIVVVNANNVGINNIQIREL